MTTPGFSELHIAFEPADTPHHDAVVVAEVLKTDASPEEQMDLLDELQSQGIVQADVNALRRQRIVLERRRESNALRLMQLIRTSYFPPTRPAPELDYGDD